ncbi:hypothetical protein VPH35_079468 [Triticum aestivum]
MGTKTKGSFPAYSFQPHAVDEAPRYPSSVLLDSKAYFADRENGTTAEAQSITGRTVKVTFCLADPPAVSHFCVHGPGFNIEDYTVEPRVISSDRDLALLGFAFAASPRSNVQGRGHAEYFVYKAGRGGRPSLTPIPATPPGIRNTWYVGIVSTLQVQAQLSRIRVDDLFIAPHKVITLGGGMVAWVDLWRGIIVCNILEEEADLFIYFIPLPKPEFNLLRKGDPIRIRDVTFCNDVIKFVEMDHHVYRQEGVTKRFKVTKDLDSIDRLHDVDILLTPHDDFIGAHDQQEQINNISDGWKVRTCYRHLSWDHWFKGHVVHVDGILVDDALRHYALSHQRWDDFAETLALSKMWDGNVGRITLRNLTTNFPILNTNGDDVVYMMVNCHAKNYWMVGVVWKKTVAILKPYSAERAYHFEQIFLPSAFSQYLNTSPRQPPRQNTSSIHGYQHPVSGQSNLPQGTHPGNANVAFVEGCLRPMHACQSRYPVPVVYTDAHGQSWLAVPLGQGSPQLASLVPSGSAPLNRHKRSNTEANAI